MRRREQPSLHSTWVTPAGSIPLSPAAHARLAADIAGAREPAPRYPDTTRTRRKPVH